MNGPRQLDSTISVKPSDGSENAGALRNPLANRFRKLGSGQTVSWTVHYRLLRELGSGGQGVVYLAERLAAHNITLPVALKVFSPQSYDSVEIYEREMARIARLAGFLALVQNDHLLDVHNFVECDGLHVMVMEHVDGFDLKQLLRPEAVTCGRQHSSPHEWDHIQRTLFQDSNLVAFQPGVAVAILRNCLAALGAMHRLGVTHGDIKPANIMLTRGGTAKVVDFGSAAELGEIAPHRKWTPQYAAIEVQQGGSWTPRSDLCSLGYVLIEMLAGRGLFGDTKSYEALIAAKQELPQRLPNWLPKNIAGNSLLMKLIIGLIAPDPQHRFASAEAADLSETGAAVFHRQLIHGNLASEYANDLRLWLLALGKEGQFAGPSCGFDSAPTQAFVPAE